MQAARQGPRGHAGWRNRSHSYKLGIFTTAPLAQSQICDQASSRPTLSVEMMPHVLERASVTVMFEMFASTSSVGVSHYRAELSIPNQWHMIVDRHSPCFVSKFDGGDRRRADRYHSRTAHANAVHATFEL
jgi:hypothetical protein